MTFKTQKKAVAPKKESPEVEAAPADNENKIVTEFTNLTPEEMAIARRVQGEDEEWKHPIGEESALDYSLGGDPLKLPPPAQKMKDNRKYAFRWIERRPDRVDQIRNKQMPLRWWICNRTNTPFLEKYIDPVLGCVCLEDQLLVFKPWALWEAEKALKDRLRDIRNENDLSAMHGQSRGGMEMSAAVGRPLGMGTPTREEIKGGDVLMDVEARDMLDAADGGGQSFYTDE